MTPTDQQSHNDCVRACIATVFDLPMEQVPHFVEVAGSRWRLDLMKWLAATRPQCVMLELAWPIRNAWLEGAVGIACGKSPRYPDGTIKHAVVWQEYGIAHDPHLSRDGLIGEPETVIYFAQSATLDAQLVSRERVRAAIEAEPELPGGMPDEMWQAIRNDRDAATELLRIVVRQTELGISNRLNSQAATQ